MNNSHMLNKTAIAMRYTQQFFGLLFAALLGSSLLTGCGGGSSNGNGGDTDTTQKDTSTAQLSLAPASFKAYDKASLSLKSPATDQQLKPGQNTFQFEVQNYALKQQTPDKDSFAIANSGKGQHIHFIVDNGPYDANYDPNVETELKKGDHVVLAFLSRSYHASIKNGKAFYVGKHTVGSGGKQLDVDLKAPHMFYSRPKGTYTIADSTGTILLDFFLVNTKLSPDGMQVEATINGQDFTIDKWQPYLIQGVTPGELTVRLKLVDQDGKVVDSPYNPVERTVTVKQEQAAS
jgi:hypothetical protein